MSNQIQRRRAIQVSTVALATSSLSIRSASASTANSKLQVGVIGLGGRGMYLLDDLLKRKDVQVTAVCDVHDLHYRDNPWGTGRAMGRQGAVDTIKKAYGSAEGVFVCEDYREFCARSDVDAVVVATPDHWHALCAIEAMDSGKDVYCEKPVAHSFTEGLKICEAVERNKAVFQTGSQQRSDRLFRQATEVVRNGLLGQIQRIEVGLPPGYAKPMGDSKIEKTPDGLDYDIWCGPAKKLPYMRARHHRWWRGSRVFGGGVLMDWIGHHNDIAQWSIGEDASGPRTVEAVNWRFPETEVYDTPHQYEIRCTHARSIESVISSQSKVGTKWIGEDGWLHVTRGRITASNPEWKRRGFDAGPENVYVSNDHMQNFLDCIRSRNRCVSPPDVTLRSITPGLLGYVSQQLRREIFWDGKKQQIVGDDEASQLLLAVEMREPYRLG